MTSQATVWLPIPGHEGSYEVSSDGRVRSLDRIVGAPHGFTRSIKGREMWQATHGKGYKFVHLSPEKRTDYVHRLVALAFLGPLPEGMVVCHNDGDPTNNRADNLRYATQSENEKDKIRHGTSPNAAKTHCPKGHPYDEANTIRDRRGWRNCRSCRVSTRSVA